MSWRAYQSRRSQSEFSCSCLVLVAGEKEGGARSDEPDSRRASARSLELVFNLSRVVRASEFVPSSKVPMRGAAGGRIGLSSSAESQKELL